MKGRDIAIGLGTLALILVLLNRRNESGQTIIFPGAPSIQALFEIPLSSGGIGSFDPGSIESALANVGQQAANALPVIIEQASAAIVEGTAQGLAQTGIAAAKAVIAGPLGIGGLDIIADIAPAIVPQASDPWYVKLVKPGGIPALITEGISGGFGSGVLNQIIQEKLAAARPNGEGSGIAIA